MSNLYDKSDWRDRLPDAVEWSRQQMQGYRENRVKFLRQFTGRHYADFDTSPYDQRNVPLNLLELAINTWVRELAARNPKVIFTTIHKDLKPDAYNITLATNHLLSAEELNFKRTLRRAIKEACFGIGIIKVGLMREGEIKAGGKTVYYAQPDARLVTLDDFVIDMAAHDISAAAYMGHRYRMPLEQAKEEKLFKSEGRKNLSEMRGQAINEDGFDRADSIGAQQAERIDLSPQVQLWELYVPGENKVLTYASDETGKISNDLLREVDWDGPRRGPYHFLSFEDVPGNILPLAPAAILLDMHETANVVLRKLSRQAERQKSIVGAMPGGGDDAERIRTAGDGDIITVQGPDKIKEHRFGGIDQLNLAFFMQLRQLFSQQAGNLDVLTGLGPQADTATQDAIINENASKRIADMQDAVYEFTRSIVHDLGFWFYTDPLMEIPISKKIQGTEFNITTNYTPEMRDADYYEYNFEVQPYSMQPQTPQRKIKMLMEIMQGVVMPLAEIGMQQGAVPNLPKLLQIISELGDLPELQDVIAAAANPLAKPIGTAPRSHERQAAPTNTTRRYIRESRPGATRNGQDYALSQLLMGGQPQRDEMAGLARSA